MLNPSDAQEVARTLAKVFSGYVHGSSVHILDMYGGNPPHYYLSGMRGTRHQKTFEYHVWHYFQRSLGAFLDAAMTFGLDDLTQSISQFMEQYYGKTETYSLDNRVKEMRRNASTTDDGVRSSEK